MLKGRSRVTRLKQIEVGMGALIRLQWRRYPDGFKIIEDRGRSLPLAGFLVRGAPDPPPEFEECLVPINPKRFENYVLEGTDEHVFLELANVHSVDDAIAFASRRGFLCNLHGASLVEDVTKVLGRAEAVRLAILHAENGQGVQLDDFLVEFHMQPEIVMRTARFVGDSAPRFFLEPPDLFTFCVAELCQFVQGGTKIRGCPRCGTLFTLGTVGQQREYCSDACRVAMHRRRKREREQRATKSPRSRGDQ
jgi:hypothetical protein